MSGIRAAYVKAPPHSPRHFRPTLFPDLFGPIADTPHIEASRLTAFVFLTCVVSKPRKKFHNS